MVRAESEMKIAQIENWKMKIANRSMRKCAANREGCDRGERDVTAGAVSSLSTFHF